MTKKRIFGSILLLLTFSLTVFIFWNSLKTGEESGEMSGRIVSLVQGVLKYLGIEIGDYPLGVFIRKAAHFGEYALLSASMTGAIWVLMGKRLAPIALLYSAGAAVIDEFVFQAMTEGRAPAVTDVLIDISGAVFAFIFIYIISRKIKREE